MSNGLNQLQTRAQDMAVRLEAFADWDEAAHPRGKTTSESRGGSFAPKATAKPPTRAEVEKLAVEHLENLRAKKWPFDDQQIDKIKSDLWSNQSVWEDAVGMKTGYQFKLTGSELSAEPFVPGQYAFQTFEQKAALALMYSEKLGWPAESVKIMDGEGPEFSVGGSQSRAAGLAYIDNYIERPIELYLGKIDNPRDLLSLISHEVQHHRTMIAETAFKRDWSLIEALPKLESGYPDIIRASGALSTPELKKRFPAYAALSEVYGYSTSDARLYDKLVATGPKVSSYAARYWKDYAAISSGDNRRNAIHETLSEMAASEASGTSSSGWYNALDAQPKVWRDTYQAYKRVYSQVTGLRRLPKGRAYVIDDVEALPHKLGPFTKCLRKDGTLLMALPVGPKIFALAHNGHVAPVLAYADEQGHVTPTTRLDTPQHAVSAPVNGYGRVLAYADADGHVYAEWDESKHPRDDHGMWVYRNDLTGRQVKAQRRPIDFPLSPFTSAKGVPLQAAIRHTLKNLPSDQIKDLARGVDVPMSSLLATQAMVVVRTDLEPKGATFYKLGGRYPVVAELPDGSRHIVDGHHRLERERAAGMPSAHVILVKVSGPMDFIGNPVDVKGAVKFSAYSISRPLYVHRPVLNADAIIAWAKSVGFLTTLPAEDMHVTICYSKEPVDWLALEHMGDVEEFPSGERKVITLGEDGAVVLRFESAPLTARHQYFLDQGASWDYDEYHPHITLTYDAPEGLDLGTVEPYSGPIVLGPEEFEEVEEGWAEGVREHAEEIGVWRTIRGRKVFIREGESLDSALKRSLKGGKNVPGRSEVLVYHGTVSSVLEKIRKEGLVPQKFSVEEDVVEKRKAIFATDNLKQAKLFARMNHGGPGKTPIVLELRVPAKMWWEEFKIDFRMNEATAKYRPGKIPPELIVGALRIGKSGGIVRLFSSTGILKEVIPIYTVVLVLDQEQRSFAQTTEIDYAQIGKDLDALEAKFRDELRDLLTQSRNVLLATVRRRGDQLDKMMRDLELPYTKDIQNAIRDALQRAMTRGGADAAREVGQAKQYAEWDESKHPRDEDGEFAPKDFPKGIVLFHGTSDEAINSIQENGIIPAKGKGANAWSEMKGWKGVVEGEVDIGERAVSVYLSEDPDTARTYARYAAEVTKGYATIIRVRIPSNEVSKLKLDEREGGGVRFPGKIDPKWIIKAPWSRKQWESYQDTHKDLEFYIIMIADQLGLRTHAYAAPASSMPRVWRIARGRFTPEAAIKWMRAKSFWVSDVLTTGLTEDIRGVIISGLKTGKPNSEIITEVARTYVPYLGDPAAVATPGADLPTAARLETVVRTNITEAYNRGRLDQYVKPSMMPFLDGIEYSAILDSRTTPVCRFLDGKVFKPTDPELGSLTPPNHFNCRSLLVPRLVGGRKIEPGDFITPAEIEQARDLADAKFLEQEEDVHEFYDPDQPRVPKGAEDGGQWSGSGVGQYFKDASVDGKGAAAWRKKMQSAYNTDKEFHAVADATMLFTQGDYSSVRAMSVQEITGELPEKYRDSSLPEWRDKPMFGNPLASYKVYFEEQSFGKENDNSDSTWGEGARALNNAIRTAAPLGVPIYRGVYGRENMDKLLAMKLGQTFDMVGPTSFTSDENMARQFARGEARGQGGGGDRYGKSGLKKAVIEVLPGAKGIAVQALSPWKQSEVISSGRFRIKEIQFPKIETNTVRVIVEQVDTFRNTKS